MPLFFGSWVYFKVFWLDQLHWPTNIPLIYNSRCVYINIFSIDGIELGLLGSYIILAVNNQQGFFFNCPSFRKTESFSSSGEILFKNTDLHERSLYPLYLYIFPVPINTCITVYTYITAKRLARRTIWRGLYRSHSYCGYRFKYLRK